MSDAKPVIVYGNASCPYCGAARMLLTKKSIRFTDVDVSKDPSMLEEMEKRSGKRTVPQILVGDTPIGGFDELYALEKSGELEKLLAD